MILWPLALALIAVPVGVARAGDVLDSSPPPHGGQARSAYVYDAPPTATTAATNTRAGCAFDEDDSSKLLRALTPAPSRFGATKGGSSIVGKSYGKLGTASRSPT